MEYLFQCNKESARVWNECVKLNNKVWKEKNKFIDRKYLQTKLKGFSPILPAKAVQLIEKKFLGAIKGIQQARKQGRLDERYPWRIKKNYNTLWDKQMVDTKDNYIYLAKPMIKNSGGKSVRQDRVKIYSKYIPPNICYAEVLYDNGLKLALNYYIESEDIKQIKSDDISAIDLGEIHSITSVDTLGNTTIITGRKIRSFNRFRNKELGKLQKKLSKCTKGSRNYKKYTKAIVKLKSKSNAKINNSLHSATKQYKNYCLDNDIGQVVIGDLNNFNMNLDQAKNRKGQKQRLVQWNHGKLVNMLTYKLLRHGIKIDSINEQYTSQTCPNCGNKYKPKSRNYTCKECGFKLHRDVVGAYNILSKYINNGEIRKLDLELKPLKYLRTN